MTSTVVVFVCDACCCWCFVSDRASAELPPPYVPSGATGISSINCKVCRAVINLEGKASQLVVKCCSCNEATVSFLAVVCFVVMMFSSYKPRSHRLQLSLYITYMDD